MAQQFYKLSCHFLPLSVWFIQIRKIKPQAAIPPNVIIAEIIISTNEYVFWVYIFG